MSIRKKMAVYLILVLFVLVVMATVIVLASSSQRINSNITISYTATQIAGRVTATYMIGDGAEQSMVASDDSSNKEFVFDASDTPLTGSLVPSESSIVLETGQEMVIKYTFFNRGGHPYYAVLSYTDTNSDDANIAFSYKKNESDEYSTTLPSSLEVPAMSGDIEGSATFLVKISIPNPKLDAILTGSFNWNMTKQSS